MFPLFQKSGPKSAEIYNQILKKGNLLDEETGVELVKSGKMAYHHDPQSLYGIIKATFSDQEICELTEIAYFSPFPECFAFQKGSPYRELFNIGLERLIESGILKKERQKYFPVKPQCSPKIEVIPVDISRTFSPFLVLGFGMITCLFVLAAELIVKRLNRKT